MRFDQYIGLPFRDHGRGHDGVDCWGLARLVLAEQFGVGQLPEPGYTHTRDTHRIPVAIMMEAARWPRVAIGNCGDLIVFNVGGQPMHIGVCLGDGTMLHIEQGNKGALIESYMTPKWQPRIEGIYRYGR